MAEIEDRSAAFESDRRRACPATRMRVENFHCGAENEAREEKRTIFTNSVFGTIDIESRDSRFVIC